ncbi:IPT/TIG domain-containing protein [Geobacter pickeringii]|uniref:Transcription factor n=1 Tax=Geobacter pickeringii TaxID=345632 RepID=A0A0B5B8H1_9BACT|nr:IPT/TIG domain-containing protein [Geobacter pickeringii]AJE02973.1 transcription factor [Geobacter pickeringii]
MRYRPVALVLLATLALAQPAWPAAQNGRKKPAKNVPATEKSADSAPAVNILSIIPAQGEPNSTVTLSGTSFTGKTVAFLGNTEVPTKVISSQTLTFDIPKLAPGLYALFLRREDGTTSRTYNFSILPPKPIVDSISPDSIAACSGGAERRIIISGHNFEPGSKVLFDGSIVTSSPASSESISFSVPPAPGGLHQVQVKNPEETVTTPITLSIRSTPEVYNVSRGENFVNYYKLIIEGKNFHPGSSLMVEEKSFQVGLNAGIGKRITAGAISSGERESVIFVDCSKLIYQRFPADPTEKDLRIQIINPNGEVSSVVQVTAP